MNELGKDWKYPIEKQHLAGNPKIYGKDIDLLRRMSFEAMFSTGITVEFYKCCYDESDFYTDPDCKWENKTLISAIFEDNPRVKVLKDLGWYSEDEEIRAPIIYLPMYKDWTTKEIFEVTDNSLVKVHYFGMKGPTEFRIMEKKMDSVYGVYWICKLAPERLEDFYETIEHGTHFLKKRDDRQEGCEHEIHDVHEDDREFHHSDYENTFGKRDEEGILIDEGKDTDDDDYFSRIMND